MLRLALTALTSVLLAGGCGGQAIDEDSGRAGAGVEDAQDEARRHYAAVCERIGRAGCGRTTAEGCLQSFIQEEEGAARQGCQAEFTDFARCRASAGFDCVRDNHIVWRSGCHTEHAMLEVCLDS